MTPRRGFARALLTLAVLGASFAVPASAQTVGACEPAGTNNRTQTSAHPVSAPVACQSSLQGPGSAQRWYSLQVPTGGPTLRATMTAATQDVLTLELRFGTTVTRCESVTLDGKTVRCEIASAGAGAWHIVVGGAGLSSGGSPFGMTVTMQEGTVSQSCPDGGRSQAAAKTLTPAVACAGSLSSGDDWYALSLPDPSANANSSLVAMLLPLGDSARMQLFAPGTTSPASACQDFNQGQSIRATACAVSGPAAGTWTMRIFATAGGTGSYALAIDVTNRTASTGQCEPAGDSTQASPRALTLTGGAVATCNGTLTPGDPSDWFSVGVAAPSGADPNLVYALFPYAGTKTAEMKSPSAPAPSAAGCSTPAAGATTCSASPAEAGTWSLGVLGNAGGYQILVAVLPTPGSDPSAAATCERADASNDRATATPFTTHLTPTQTQVACRGAVDSTTADVADWFSVPVRSAIASIRIVVLPGDQTQTLSVTLVDPRGTDCARAVGSASPGAPSIYSIDTLCAAPAGTMKGTWKLGVAPLGAPHAATYTIALDILEA